MKKVSVCNFPEAQQGMVLLVGLVMLLLLSLMAVSGFNLTQTNLKVVQNLESRSLARQAANSAVEEAISSNLFLSGSGSIFASSCGQPNHKCYDLNGDGVNDVDAAVELKCAIVKNITDDEVNARADVERATDPDCQGKTGGDGVCKSNWESCLGGGSSGNSLCSDVVWDFVAVATDLQTGAEVQVRQGLSTPANSNAASNICD